MVTLPHPGESHSESTPHSQVQEHQDSPPQRPAWAQEVVVRPHSPPDWSGGQSSPLNLAEGVGWALLTCCEQAAAGFRLGASVWTIVTKRGSTVPQGGKGGGHQAF